MLAHDAFTVCHLLHSLVQRLGSARVTLQQKQTTKPRQVNSTDYTCALSSRVVNDRLIFLYVFDVKCMLTDLEESSWGNTELEAQEILIQTSFTREQLKRKLFTLSLLWFGNLKEHACHMTCAICYCCCFFKVFFYRFSHFTQGLRVQLLL